MLHTVIDLQQVLSDSSRPLQKTVLKPYKSGFMEYTVRDDKLIPYRLFSTNPSDYLSKEINC